MRVKSVLNFRCLLYTNTDRFELGNKSNNAVLCMAHPTLACILRSMAFYIFHRIQVHDDNSRVCIRSYVSFYDCIKLGGKFGRLGVGTPSTGLPGPCSGPAAPLGAP